MKLLSIYLDILHHDRSSTTDAGLTAEERLKAKFGEDGLAHQVNEPLPSNEQSCGSTPTPIDVHTSEFQEEITKAVDGYEYYIL